MPLKSSRFSSRIYTMRQITVTPPESLCIYSNAISDIDERYDAYTIRPWTETQMVKGKGPSIHDCAYPRLSGGYNMWMFRRAFMLYLGSARPLRGLLRAYVRRRLYRDANALTITKSIARAKRRPPTQRSVFTKEFYQNRSISNLYYSSSLMTELGRGDLSIFATPSTGPIVATFRNEIDFTRIHASM